MKVHVGFLSQIRIHCNMLFWQGLRLLAYSFWCSLTIKHMGYSCCVALLLCPRESYCSEIVTRVYTKQICGSGIPRMMYIVIAYIAVGHHIAIQSSLHCSSFVTSSALPEPLNLLLTWESEFRIKLSWNAPEDLDASCKVNYMIVTMIGEVSRLFHSGPWKGHLF